MQTTAFNLTDGQLRHERTRVAPWGEMEVVEETLILVCQAEAASERSDV